VDEYRAPPQRFGEILREFKPIVIQISGGEPLVRKDVEQIIETLKQYDDKPYMIVVTNAALLTEDKYHRFLELGIDQYSISLDFPDERHDEFRNIPSLFQHIKDLINTIMSEKDKKITLNSVIQSSNFRDAIKMAELARDWGVNTNFSPYTWLRTNDKGYMIPKDEIPEFRDIIGKLIDFKRRYNTIQTSDSFLYDMVEFFKNESIPNCRAGERFLVVNPDATLSPCGLITTDYHSLKKLKEDFVADNTCISCHTCIRAGSEKPLNNFTWGWLKSVFHK
jgi:MoaA/NifB/PqqE/SkfB family radical SAM enzyme